MRETQTDHLYDRSAKVWWRLIIQISLIVVAAMLLLTRPYLVSAIRHEELDARWLLLLPCTFLVVFALYVVGELFSRREHARSALNYIQIGFGLVIIALSFPSSLREYNARRLPEVSSLELIEKFTEHKDASLRALAILALSRHNFNNKKVGALIHSGLLDKDPLVQQAAKLVIEENFGIRLRNGAEGIHQAQTFIQDVGPQALLIRKGSP